MRDTKKKGLPEDLQRKVYGLWEQEGWSYQQISAWLAGEPHHLDFSREWIRRLLEGMKAAKKTELPFLRDAEPEELDGDGQLESIQHDVYRTFKGARRAGDLAGAMNAARTHVAIVLARKRLRDPAPGTAEPDAPLDAGLRMPSFGVVGVGVISGRS